MYLYVRHIYECINKYSSRNTEIIYIQEKTFEQTFFIPDFEQRI